MIFTQCAAYPADSIHGPKPRYWWSSKKIAFCPIAKMSNITVGFIQINTIALPCQGNDPDRTNVGQVIWQIKYR